MSGQTSALSRAGIIMTEYQEKVLKTGTEEERAATLAKVLEQNVGGVNEALAQTDAGKVAVAGNLIGRTSDLIGEKLMSVKGKLAELLIQYMPQIQEKALGLVTKLDTWIGNNKDTIVNAFQTAATIGKTAFTVLSSAISFFINNANWLIDLAAPGFATSGAAVPFGVGGRGEGEEGQRLARVGGPDKSPLGGQLLRFLGVNFTVIDLEEPNHPPGAGPADKAIFLACLALQHVFGSLGRLEVRDILLCGTEFRAGHGGGFCLQVDCGSLPRPAQGIQNKLFFSQRHSLLLELLPPWRPR